MMYSLRRYFASLALLSGMAGLIFGFGLCFYAASGSGGLLPLAVPVIAASLAAWTLGCRSAGASRGTPALTQPTADKMPPEHPAVAS